MRCIIAYLIKPQELWDLLNVVKEKVETVKFINLEEFSMIVGFVFRITGKMVMNRFVTKLWSKHLFLPNTSAHSYAYP